MSRKSDDSLRHWFPSLEDEKKFGKNRNENRETETKIPLPAKTSDDDEAIRARFLARQSLIKCDAVKSSNSNRPVYTYAGNEHYEVCLLRKVASSFVGIYTRNLTHGNETTHVEFYGKPPSRLVIVRDPYTRLVSGYLDRVLNNPQKMNLFKPREVKKFWPNATSIEAEARCLCAVSFQQFAKYLIHFHKSGKPLDNHFKPMSAQCNPCRIKFDFIVHLETFNEDMMYIFKRLNMSAFSPHPTYARGVSVRPRAFEKMLSGTNPCKSLCSVFRDLWWSYQVTGFMARDFKFPVSAEKCANISAHSFSQLAFDAIRQSKDRFDKSLQKRQMMIDLILQLPLEDRIQIRDILAQDFKLFGYDPQPADLFPELAKDPKE